MARARIVRQKTPAECIGDILRSAMSAKGITAEQLADALGITIEQLVKGEC